MAWAYLGLRAVLVLSRCVSYCAAVSPCIAVVTDIWRTESGRSQRFTEPLAPPDLRWPAVLGAGPARPGRSLVVDGLAHPQPTGSGGSRGDPADLGVSPWTVAELRCLAPWRFIALPRPAAGPWAGPRMAGRVQRPATDEPAPSPALVSADLSLTCHVPAVDLSCTSRDGTDDR